MGRRLLTGLRIVEWELRYTLSAMVVLFGMGITWVAEQLIYVGAWIIDEELDS